MLKRNMPLRPGFTRRHTADQCCACYSRTVRNPRGELRERHGVRAAYISDDGTIDAVAVRRASLGDQRLRLTKRELASAVHLLLTDVDMPEIAMRLGVSVRTVLRLSEAGEPNGMPARSELIAAA